MFCYSASTLQVNLQSKYWINLLKCCQELTQNILQTKQQIINENIYIINLSTYLYEWIPNTLKKVLCNNRKLLYLKIQIFLYPVSLVPSKCQRGKQHELYTKLLLLFVVGYMCYKLQSVYTYIYIYMHLYLCFIQQVGKVITNLFMLYECV